MAPVSDRLVTVFGGSGFVGRNLVRSLAKRGFRVRVAVRRPDLARFLMTAGAVGQIHGMQANIRYPASIAAAVEGAEAVVNLVGVMHDGRNGFDAVQAFGAGAIARAAEAAGVQRLVHVSSLSCEAGAEAHYARSKAQGEAAVRSAFADAIIVRPSAIFGSDDNFFNRFAALARLSPVLPLIGGGDTKFQPVFVGDVAEVLARGVEGGLRPGTTYELGGQEIMTLRDIFKFVLKVTNRKRLLVPMPFALANLQAAVLGLLPNAPLTRDQVALLRRDNIVSAAAQAEGRTLEGLGIQAATVEAIVPGYLWRFRKSGQFEHMPA
ncbi:complex I NDUFA9 subunit family protein [Labrys monachus]|uniref:NADH dehydrogenase n=1 Tax=Labrys monachus TaxID=217067 RepID=A0ABU0FCD1_9HYPH|nr:complex I NDUFA9 subunit family protein [Labrys monachus]MDQ0392276.1 NADH dehydrogenase [Labrys monachus]